MSIRRKKRLKSHWQSRAKRRPGRRARRAATEAMEEILEFGRSRRLMRKLKKGKKKLAEASGGFIRDRLREASFARRILPPNAIP